LKSGVSIQSLKLYRRWRMGWIQTL